MRAPAEKTAHPSDLRPLEPKAMKPKVSRTTLLGTQQAWVAQCPCAFFWPLTWPTKDGKQAMYFQTQRDAFFVALDHARREHWTEIR